jgi:Fe-S cluster assembly iron-binding protein IscA
MTKLTVDDKAIEFIKAELEKEQSPAVRLSVTGGGCCQHLGITTVEKEIARDVKHIEKGVTFHVEKYLDDNASSIEIHLDDERKMLMVNMNYKID